MIGGKRKKATRLNVWESILVFGIGVLRRLFVVRVGGGGGGGRRGGMVRVFGIEGCRLSEVVRLFIEIRGVEPSL